jgi:hypothetical protein
MPDRPLTRAAIPWAAAAAPSLAPAATFVAPSVTTTPSGVSRLSRTSGSSTRSRPSKSPPRAAARNAWTTVRSAREHLGGIGGLAKDLADLLERNREEIVQDERPPSGAFGDRASRRRPEHRPSRRPSSRRRTPPPGPHRHSRDSPCPDHLVDATFQDRPAATPPQRIPTPTPESRTHSLPPSGPANAVNPQPLLPEPAGHTVSHRGLASSRRGRISR